ncbi:uncharacterized protein BT62DRAFT_923651 [Guyanagaster necrorhizus]|uniref:Uncharacterized protein n=1 Tax=Guyanagaster necrorhizus TaxID=856835 RepID=A0A9P7VI01_9AGAR|nr:uncharacterized protein BT62DRAFT_923651 [Guyanagaster necrorhizus MCA 3950]KAG7440933.1 hypothetical protein BT62DRAFT_923651 [Guyanagaster necrorhizus MCA 3950]
MWQTVRKCTFPHRLSSALVHYPIRQDDGVKYDGSIVKRQAAHAVMRKPRHYVSGTCCVLNVGATLEQAGGSWHPASPMNPRFQTLAYTRNAQVPVLRSIKACLYYSTFPRSFLPSSSAAPGSSLLSSSVIVWPAMKVLSKSDLIINTLSNLRTDPQLEPVNCYVRHYPQQAMANVDSPLGPYFLTITIPLVMHCTSLKAAREERITLDRCKAARPLTYSVHKSFGDFQFLCLRARSVVHSATSLFHMSIECMYRDWQSSLRHRDQPQYGA